MIVVLAFRSRHAASRLRRRALPAQSARYGCRPEARQLARDVLGGQDEVDAAGADGAARHVVVLGRCRLLGEGDPALGLDRLQTQRAVRAHAGQDHADGLASLHVGQGLAGRNRSACARTPRGLRGTSFSMPSARIRPLEGGMT